MQQLKIERNEDGTYTITVGGKTHKAENTDELHDFLKRYNL